MKLFEAVPNFSEGRDATKVARIVQAGRAVTGVAVLDVESDPAHNRSVVSLAGEAAPLSEALFQMVRAAIELIDLNHHTGEHPRMGAVDVVPIVPFGDAGMEEAKSLAERLAQRVWTELGLPVYLYADSARRPDRADLAQLRRGEFEGIRAEIGSDPGRKPDFGDPKVHPTAGIVAIGLSGPDRLQRLPRDGRGGRREVDRPCDPRTGWGTSVGQGARVRDRRAPPIPGLDEPH